MLKSPNDKKVTLKCGHQWAAKVNPKKHNLQLWGGKKHDKTKNIQVSPQNSNANPACWHARPPFPRWHVNTSQRYMPPRTGQGSQLRLVSPQTRGPDRIFSRKRCRNPLEKTPFEFPPFPRSLETHQEFEEFSLHILVVYPQELVKSTTVHRARRGRTHTQHTISGGLI